MTNSIPERLSYHEIHAQPRRLRRSSPAKSPSWVHHKLMAHLKVKAQFIPHQQPQHQPILSSQLNFELKTLNLKPKEISRRKLPLNSFSVRFYSFALSKKMRISAQLLHLTILMKSNLTKKKFSSKTLQTFAASAKTQNQNQTWLDVNIFTVSRYNLSAAVRVWRAGKARLKFTAKNLQMTFEFNPRISAVNDADRTLSNCKFTWD